MAADAAGDHDRAAQLHHEGREIFVKAGDLGGQGSTLSRLSWAYYLKGDFELARRYALEGLAKFETIDHTWGIAISFGRLGLTEIEAGRLPGAAEHFLACLDEATEGLVEQHSSRSSPGSVVEGLRTEPAEAAGEAEAEGLIVGDHNRGLSGARSMLRARLGQG